MNNDGMLLLCQYEIYRRTLFAIGYTLLEQSKGHIEDKEALRRIRTALLKCRVTKSGGEE